MRFLIIPVLVFLGILPEINAQDRDINLRNPSFEGIPHIGNLRLANRIMGWNDCGLRKFPGESPPDLQPGFFSCDKDAFDGRSYIGLVVRDNDTWESVSQSLSAPMESGKCYSFSLYLSKSKDYLSPARNTGIMVEEAESKGEEVQFINHNTPCVLRIWGGQSACQSSKTELLAETDVIDNLNWEEFEFKLEPTQEHYFITLEAYVKTPSLFPYNGHVLIDNLSKISPIPCDDPAPEVTFEKPEKNIKVTEELFEIVAAVEHVESDEDLEFILNGKNVGEFSFAKATNKFYSKIRLKEGKNNIRLKGTNKSGSDQEDITIVYEMEKEPEETVVETPKEVEAPPVKPEKPLSKTIAGVEKKELKEQQTLEIKNLRFEADSFRIVPTFYPTLDEIYGFLKSNKEVIVEIGGHTNNNCDEIRCKELSEKRAKAVADYLKSNGIPSTQLKYKGYGSKNPITTNKTALGKKKNQRVEIKILSMGG